MTKTTLLFKFTGITSLISFAYYIISLFIDFELFTYLMFFDTIVFALLCYGAKMAASQYQRLITQLYIAFFVIETFMVSAFSGGPESLVLPWFCVSPILALLLLGKKETFLWAAICFIAILLLIPADWITSQTSWYFLPWSTSVFNTTLNLGLLCMIVLLTWLFSERNMALQVQLGKNVEELKTIEEELRQNMEELSATQDFLIETNQKLKESVDLLRQKNIEIENNRNYIRVKKEKVEDFSKVLNVLTRSEPMRQGELEQSLKLLTQQATSTLNIDRVSVWLYDIGRSKIICKMLYDQVTNDFEQDMVLTEQDFPVYMSKIKREETIIAVDAHVHPATAGFSEIYLKPNAIQSMLDIPLLINAQSIGVVCFEKRHHAKYWDEEDRAFAMSVTDLITISIQSSEQLQTSRQVQRQREEIGQQHLQLQKLTNELLHINHTLEERVKERTTELEDKNKSFAEYTFINVHLLRAPMCQIMGLSGLLKYTELSNEQTELLRKLDTSTQELEQLIKKTTQLLEAGEKLDRTVL